MRSIVFDEGSADGRLWTAWSGGRFVRSYSTLEEALGQEPLARVSPSSLWRYLQYLTKITAGRLSP